MSQAGNEDTATVYSDRISTKGVWLECSVVLGIVNILPIFSVNIPFLLVWGRLLCVLGPGGIGFILAVLPRQNIAVLTFTGTFL